MWYNTIMTARKDGCSKCEKRYEKLDLSKTIRVDSELICGDCLRQLIRGNTMHDSGKDTNPKDALGIKKAPLHCIPCGPLYELGLAMMEGGRKYGTHNYRAVGVRASVYYDAIMRHITQWWEGENIDFDSELHPLIKAAASIVVMRDGMLMDNYIDDRPIKYPNGLNMSKFNEKAKKIIEKYPDYVTPFLERDKKEFVVPEGWVIVYNNPGNHHCCGWYIKNISRGALLWKNGLLEDNCYSGWRNHKYGEAPGYWPTEADAKAALKQYLEGAK